MLGAETNEISKLYRLGGPLAYHWSAKMMNQYMKHHHVDSPRIHRMWTWKDQTKMVEFLKLHKFWVKKYGLDIPYDLNHPLSKDELKTREDELVEYFLYEMRKKPVE